MLGQSKVVRADDAGSGVDRRRSAVLVTLGVVLVLSCPAVAAVLNVGSDAPGSVRALIIADLVLPAAVVIASVGGKHFSLAWSSYWLWSLVFVGLAPAYQITAGAYPWGGRFDSQVLRTALSAILLGHAIVLVIGVLVGARRAARATALRARLQSSHDGLDLGGKRVITGIRIALIGQVAVSVVFAALMGPNALMHGRTVFRVRLLEVADLPGGGSLYFLATAFAIIVPALGVACKRQGIALRMELVLAGIIGGAIVTNPLIGSRFLTGAFILAVAGAALTGRELARFLPAVMIMMLVTVFPSLDLFRGDGTGATSLAVAAPADALQTFDFDSFEMLARATIVHDAHPDAINPALLLAGPVLRWVPFAARGVVDAASGPLVARATGMTYANVSMPLWGEGYLVSGLWGAAGFGGALGVWLMRLRRSGARTRHSQTIARLLDAPTAALLFIVLRGSLYEVLGYLLLVVTVFVALKSVTRDAVQLGVDAAQPASGVRLMGVGA